MDVPPEKTVFVPRSGGGGGGDLFQTGDLVGQYRIEKPLGAGGMGVVYLVKHTALKKLFALKALPAKLAQEASFVTRFKREAEMLARLKDPHIVNVTDFGESQGKLYLVLEYVDGGSLEDWFHALTDKGGHAPVGEVRRIMMQVLQGLAHAHAAGIIHRDLKPANVLMEKNGAAKISDFGLARVVQEEEYRRAGGTGSPFHGDSVTTTGSIVGTIDFMSPEARSMKPSDARSDIYAVGVIAYYLLTGKKPHGIAQLASKLVPGLDPRWDKFIGTCLAEDPADRHQTADEALKALERMQRPESSGPGRKLIPAALALVIAAGVGVWVMKRNKALAPVGEQPPVAQQAVPAAKSEPVPVALPTPARAEPEPLLKQPVAPSIRRFTLTGLPAGALVTYDGRNHTVGSAGRLTLEMPPGAQHVKVTAPGHQDWEGAVGAAEGVGEGAVPLELLPPHPVRFTGLPPQAELSVDGRSAVADARGTATLELRPGRFTLSASAPKYETLTLPVDILTATEAMPLEMKRLPPPKEVVVELAADGPVKFKWVPAGVFYLGSPPDEHGRQRNDLARARTEIPKGFYIAETETTQKQHRMLTNRNPSTSRALGDESRPVEQVAWRDITGPGGAIEKFNEALRRLGLPYKADLPTETEWEYACRAGAETAFNDGSQLTNERDDPALTALACYSRGGTALTAPSPVAMFKANAWGLFDMHGNVAEWAHGVRGPREPALRGGNWKVGSVHCRSASRVEVTTEVRPTDVMGYRLVLRPTED